MFFKRFEIMIALRYLKSKRKDSFISVVSMFSLIGIALGVATLIVVMSVMNGYHKEFLKNILGMQGHISAINIKGNFTEYKKFEQLIALIKDVKFVAPTVIEQAMIVSKKGSSGAVVRGIEPDKLAMKPLLIDGIEEQDLKRFATGEGIIVGKDLAKQLRIELNDSLKIITPNTSSTLIGSIPRIKTFKVIGTFDVGLYQYNSTTLFMTLKDAQNLFKHPGSVTEVEIMVDNPEDIEALKSHIANISGNDIRLIDWHMAQGKWLNALTVERNVMFLILTLIILVAVFNIISTLIMLVKDKARGIAILRTMGATKNSIIKIFVLCGSILGIAGTCIGSVLGIAFALNIERIRSFLESMSGYKLFDPVIYFLTKLPSDLEFGSVALITGMSIFFSILSTIYPAYRASKLLPAEILRYE
jgi:lipoprotein-releasing system permease protein